MQPSKTVSLINWMTSDSFNKKIGKVILLMRGQTFSQHWLRVWVIEQKHSHQLSFSKNTFFQNQLLSASSKRIIVSHTDPPILYTFYFLFVHVLLSHHFFLLWSFQSQKKAVRPEWLWLTQIIAGCHINAGPMMNDVPASAQTLLTNGWLPALSPKSTHIWQSYGPASVGSSLVLRCQNTEEWANSGLTPLATRL